MLAKWHNKFRGHWLLVSSSERLWVTLQRSWLPHSDVRSRLERKTVSRAVTGFSRRLPSVQLLSCFSSSFPIFPSLFLLFTIFFCPSTTLHHTFGIKLELAKCSDMLYYQAGIVVMCLTLTCWGLIQADRAEQAPQLIPMQSTASHCVYQS